MYALLGLQITVSIFAVDLEGYGLDPGLVAVQIVQHFCTETVTVSPLHIHTVQHAGPVTGLGSACTCVKGDNSIVLVIFSGQQCFHTDIFKVCDKFIQHFLDIRDDRGIVLLVSHLYHQLDLFLLVLELVINLYIFFEGAQLLHHLLGPLRVIPEIRCLHFPL